MCKIGAIVLAAGISRRMGKPKLLLPINGKPLFRYSVEVALRNHLKPIVVIAGRNINKIREHLQDLQDVEILYNPKYEEGMSSSLKLGILSVSNRVDAAMVFLADQPFVSDLVVRNLVDEFKVSSKNELSIYRPKYQDMLGHPILFKATLFSEFNSIYGDEGGKSIIKKYRHHLKIISFDHLEWGMDIDTPEDYKSILRIRNKRSGN
ncbi:NTP transferase domain-containing protein [Bacillus sp. AFS041924]|uniref:nucleotidyltransferase family protein n=1 Tax=Bacillus sp. AFS041924 TaxID=2033503 RepID=UPI00159B8F43|nr:nucleotidyltransferase family protein [Bacillus sp. AFS041924]